MANQLITKEWNGKTLAFREDGYFNMTKAAAQFGKRLDSFMKSPETEEYIEVLNPTISGNSAVISTRGRYGGTWAHPKLAVFFARWLDVRFAVACYAMIEDILKSKVVVTKSVNLAAEKKQDDPRIGSLIAVREAVRALNPVVGLRTADILKNSELRLPLAYGERNVPGELRRRAQWRTHLPPHTRSFTPSAQRK